MTAKITATDQFTLAWDECCYQKEENKKAKALPIFWIQSFNKTNSFASVQNVILQIGLFTENI
jgi:hypothetical protein